MTSADRPWPPLIVANRVPRLIRWRDFLLTLLAWIGCAFLLEKEFHLFFGAHLARLGFGDFNTEANWPTFFERLTPFFATALFLISLLVIASLRTRVLRRRGLSVPMPAPLEVAEQCRRAGTDENTLVSAREAKIVIVHIDADGKHRFDAE